MKNEKPEILYTWNIDENGYIIISSKNRKFTPVPYNSLTVDLLLTLNSMYAMLHEVCNRNAQLEIELDRLKRRVNANTASIGVLWAGVFDNE
ncbi:MAG: hypothetical protein ACI4V4_02730 [Eubacterium sp.]